MLSGIHYFFARAYRAGLRGLRQTPGVSLEVFNHLHIPMVVACVVCGMTHTFFDTFIDSDGKFFCSGCGKARMHAQTVAKVDPLAIDPRVTAVVNAIKVLEKKYASVPLEISAFNAPSECAALVYKQQAKDLEKLYETHNIKAWELDQGLLAKMSPKAVYRLGL